MIKKNLFLVKIFVVYFILTFNAVSKQSEYFNKGIELYQKEQSFVPILHSLHESLLP